MTRALVALVLLMTAGGVADLASPVEQRHAMLSPLAAAAPPDTVIVHDQRPRATRSWRRPVLKKASLRYVEPVVVHDTYAPLVQCWNGETLVDHPGQSDCPARPKAQPTPHVSTTWSSSSSVYAFVASLPAPWPAIVHCESLRDNSWRVSSNSNARGLFQFLRSTWRRMGGTGDPAAASFSEQFAMARKLARLEGLRSWDCARMLGYA